VRVKEQGTPNSAAGTVVTKVLSIAGGPSAPTGTLDLTNNSMIIDYTGAVGTRVDDIRQLLLAGVTGHGLKSGNANSTIGVGYANNAVLSPVKTTFAGVGVDSDSLLIKFTYLGDANLDGQVDVADLGILATNWQTTQPWSGGDFDYSNFVDVNDLGLLATNWQAGVGGPLGPSGPSPEGAEAEADDEFVSIVTELGLSEKELSGILQVLGSNVGAAVL
jgi:hypothetical protein